MSYNYIVENGIIVLDTSVIKSEVEAEWRSIAGEDATIDPSSFEGRRIDLNSKQRIGVARNNVDLANQLNPNMSDGTFVDAHLSLIGSKRDSKEQSTVECDLTGVVGTIILANSFVEDDNKELWFLVSNVTIGAGNTAAGSFRSVNYGPISAGIGEINKIVSGVLGWETVNNPAAAVEGKLDQGDVKAKRQRRQELGANSKSVSYSVMSAISKLEGVEGVQFRENNTSTDATIDNVFLLAKSSWVCVDGGVTSEIVNAYYPNRYGTDFNGAVVDSFTDPISKQVIDVKFDRPTPKVLKCRIEVRVTQSQNAVADVKRAVVDYANGLVEGEGGFALGLDSSPFEVASGVNAQLPGVFVKKCELAILAGTLSSDTIVNELFEKASIVESDVVVVLV